MCCYCHLLLINIDFQYLLSMYLQITGAKAPPLKHLAEWLEQNPAYDVEAKWSELVRAKVSAQIMNISSN